MKTYLNSINAKIFKNISSIFTNQFPLYSTLHIFCVVFLKNILRKETLHGLNRHLLLPENWL